MQSPGPLCDARGRGDDQLDQRRITDRRECIHRAVEQDRPGQGEALEHHLVQSQPTGRTLHPEAGVTRGPDLRARGPAGDVDRPGGIRPQDQSPTRRVELSWKYYLSGTPEVLGLQYAAPVRAEDLSGLPPAFVQTCEFDPLRDEGLIYAQRLLAAGVRTEVHLYPGTFHGSELVKDAAISRRMASDRMDALRRALG
jgi:acetyl esterase/lipase